VLRDVKSHLEKLGYEVRTALDGRSALALAKTVLFDLVVLDINFPELSIRKDRAIDGIELLRMLREESNVPVLMLSSTNISSVKVMALSLGADDYVPKPFDLRELEARIEAILRRSGNDVAEDRVFSFRRLKLDPGSRRVSPSN
jgi:DNA-binding response OmpR family regulator